MQISKNLVSGISGAAFVILISLFTMTNCSQNKNKDEKKAEKDTVASKQNTQSPQQAMQSLQGDSAIDIEVSDKELKKFSTVVQKMQTMQSDMNQDMIDAIEKEGMDVNEFNKIMKHQQTPENQRSDSVQISEESMKKFESASKELQSIQAGSQQKFMQVLQEEGLEFKRYRQIAMALRQDNELMQRFQSMSSSNAQQGNAGAPSGGSN